MGARPDDRMVPVELVEDDGTPASSVEPSRERPPVATQGGATAGDPPAPVPGGPSPDAARRRRAVRLGAAAVVLAVGAVVVLAGREGEPPPTAVGPLATPLVERWAEPADEVLGVVDDLVVVTTLASQTPGLRALDAATGAEVWSVPFGRAGVANGCVPGITPDPPTVWCWRERHVAQQPDGEFGPVPSAIVGVAVLDGTVVAEHEALDQPAGYAVVDGDLLVGERRDALLTVRRLAVSTWQELWRTHLPLEPRTAGGAYSARLEVAHGLVVVHGPTTAVLDAVDGQVLRAWAPVDDPARTVLDGADVVVTPAGFAAWVDAVEGRRLADGVWHDRTGRPVHPFEGRLVEPAVTDGSVPEVLLVGRGGTLVGVQASSGADLWRVPLDKGRVVARRDGALLLAVPGAVRSIEVLTGIERWSREVSGLRTGVGALTDGEVVVVTAVRDRRWVAEAFRTADGMPLWSRQVPGTGEITFLAYPPGYAIVSGRPVVWVGRTLVWVSG